MKKQDDCVVYGYARVSTPKQNIDRQLRNIRQYYAKAVIYTECYTGTTSDRKEWKRLMRTIKGGDTIIFDSVSRMSRNAEEGFQDFEQLYSKGIHLIFLKEPHVNTEVFRQAISNQVAMTGTTVDLILEGVNKYLLEVARQQIRLAYEQSEKEVLDLRQRTKEGLETARRNGQVLGRPAGRTYETQKSKEKKQDILKLSRAFNGTFSDAEVMRFTGLARKTYKFNGTYLSKYINGIAD